MQNTSLLELSIRLVVSLAVVLGLMWGAAALLKRRTGGARVGAGRHGRMEVLARQPLGRNSSVTMVRVGERALVLGVTDQQVTVLAEGAADEFDPPEPVVVGDGGGRRLFATGAPRTVPPGAGGPGTPGSWKGFVEALRDKTVRRS